MLGNFSIGDYFRDEAVAWAWELLTSPKWFAFDPDKLYVTVYPDDKDSYNAWIRLGLEPGRIIPLDENFWQIGEGPCGPCTEIFYDRGPNYDPDNIGLRLLQEDLENDRYLEIWNLVLSQFNAKDGLARSEYPELPNKNIDTGMGLERMVSIIQGGDTNFDTDLFLPIIRATEAISGKQYRGESETIDTAFKVIADHIRTVTFAIADGALPSNEGRGYILRRLIRRSVRFAKKLGIERPFMYELVPVVAKVMVDFYPQITEKTAFVGQVIQSEEERFHETLNGGLEILSTVIAREKAAGSSVISGADAFRLYDTFGFPIELTEEYAIDEEMSVDHDGFEREMAEQRERARASRQEFKSMQIQSGVLSGIRDESEFVGYDALVSEAKVLYLFNQAGELIESANSGEEVLVIFDRTPFYAESGGQAADVGLVNALAEGRGQGKIVNVQKAPNGQHLHTVQILSDQFSAGDSVQLAVNVDTRNQIIKNHTATHLLHQALKNVLGEHVNQAGSQVTAERLRFDFSHFGALQVSEIEAIEQAVNEKIWDSIDLDISYKDLSEAKSLGAMALFGEKYADVVRVVQIDDSLELCGGCHVKNTAAIGLFKIVSETGIGAGTRRIEAVTGKGAYALLSGQLQSATSAAAKVKSSLHDLPMKLDSLLAEVKEAHRENESLKTKLGNIEAQSLETKVKDVNGVQLLTARVNAQDMATLRTMTDELKQKLPSVIIVLGSAVGEKVNLIAVVSPDNITKGFHAGNIIKQVASICDGSGGGRPDMAQAGGKDASKLDAALAKVAEVVANQ